MITKPEAARRASKQAMMIEMLRRAEGAYTEELMETFGWQRHTIRGLVSTLRSKGGLAIESTPCRGRGENADGSPRMSTKYWIAPPA